MADKKDNVKRNIAYDTFYRILTTITPFITAPYIARVIGAEGIGIQSYTQSIQSYFVMFASLGTAYYGSRETARCGDDVKERSRLFWEIELMCILTTSMCFVVYLPVCFFSKSYSLIYSVLAVGVLGVAFDISWFYAGLEKFRSIVLRNTVVKIMEIVLLFTLVKSPGDLVIYIAIGVISAFISYLTYWPGLKKLVVKIPFSSLRIRRHFRGVFIYFLPTIASSVYVLLDKPLIRWLTGDAGEVGYYQQAQKFVDVLKSLVFTSINYVVGVRMSSLFAEGRHDEIRRKFNSSLNYIFFMGFGCAFGLSAIARILIPVFLGPGYDEVVPLIYLFSPLVIIIGISNCIEMQYFTPCGRRAESIRYLVVGAVVNIILNLILIPHFKAFGATAATVVAESVVTLQYVLNSRDYVTFSSLWRTGWKKLLSGFVMFAVVFSMERLELNEILLLALQIICGILIYGLLLLVLRDKWLLTEMKEVLVKIGSRLKKGDKV